MSEREDLEQAIVAVEAQRASLGDAAVDTVLAGLHRKLAQLEAAEGPALQEDGPVEVGERRIVTMLFCKVADSTALAERLDPETWAGIMDEALGYRSLRRHGCPPDGGCYPGLLWRADRP